MVYHVYLGDGAAEDVFCARMIGRFFAFDGSGTTKLHAA